MRMIRLTDEYIDEVIRGAIGRRGPKLASCALTLGSFDGLHRGHQDLVGKVRLARERLGLSAAAIWTFKQHPRLVLEDSPEPFLLTTWREKLAVLHELGCEVIVAADFCPQLSRLGYRDFTEKFLVGYLGMRHLVAGRDMHLGAGRQGTAESLAALSRESGRNAGGFTLEVVDPVLDQGTIISSSVIRSALAHGEVPRAAAMLGRPYALWGEVTPGDGRGRQIGYPTANIQPLDGMKLIPQDGVYAVRVQVPGDSVGAGCTGLLAKVAETLPEVDLNGDLLSIASQDWAVFGGMLNYGRVPTFNPQGLPAPRLEAHLFGFQGDLRGRNVKVDWIQRLRPERTFGTVEELTDQLGRDQAAARAALGLPACS